MKKLFKYILLILFLNLPVFSQKEANIWYFDEYAGLDFNSVNPVELTDGKFNTLDRRYTIDSSFLIRVVISSLAGNDTTICKGSSAQLGTFITGSSDTYSWLPVIYLNNPNIPDPISTPDQTTTYTLTVRKESGVMDYDTVVVNIMESNMIFGGVNDTLDFETVCKNLNNSKTFSMTNASSVKTQFKAAITNNANNLFEFTNNTLNSIFAENETKTINMRFNGTGNFGTYYANLMITDTCGNTEEIVLKGNISNISCVVDDTLNFGRVCKDYGIDNKFKIKNTTTSVTSFDATFPGTLFSLTDDSLKNPFSFNQEKQINVRFKGLNKTGFYYDSMFVFDKCNSSHKIILKVEVVDAQISMIDYLDLGEVCAGSVKDTLLRLTNQSTIQVSLTTSIYPNNTQFELLNNPFANPIGINNILDFTLAFNAPKIPGTYSGTITLDYNCAKRHILYITAYVPDVQFTRTADTLKDSVQSPLTLTKELKFVNKGTDPLKVTHVNGLNPPMTLKSTIPALPALLNQNDTIYVFIDIQSQFGGMFTDSIRVGSDKICFFEDTTIMQIKVKAIVANTSIAIGSPSDTTEPGKEVTVPLNLTSSKNMIQSGIKDWQAVIAFNKSTLLPLNDNLIDDWIDGADHKIKFQGSFDMDQGTLYQMKFLTALGTDECPELKIENFEWYGGEYTLDTMQNGEVCIKVCKEGGLRLVNMEEPVVMYVKGPNPAYEMINININLIEEGNTELFITDILGRKVYSENIEFGSEQNKSIYIGNLPTGAYMLVLQTPTVVKTGRVEVVR